MSDCVFSSALDLTELSAQFANDGRLQIRNALSETLATALSRAMAEVDYELAFTDGTQSRTLDRAALAAMSPSEQQQLMEKVQQQAAQGIGYLYGRRSAQPSTTSSTAAQTLAQFFQRLQSNESREVVAQITGSDALRSVSGQYTRFTADHFLTRHSDIVAAEGRRFAYVFNFSPAWHPDWGGLLQFFEPDGSTRDAWIPTFNSLSLFDVRHIHSVTYITPFAAAPRYALSGWFRDR